MAKTKKYQLFVEDECEFDLFAICSHHNDYRIAWSINECMDFQLSKCHDPFAVPSTKKGAVVAHFPMFEYVDASEFLHVILIKNKHLGQHLIPELPNIDYLLFSLEKDILDGQVLINKLRELNSILGVYRVETSDLHRTDHLVFN